jgi:hypothetical protein
LAVLFLTQRKERSILTPNQQNTVGKGGRGDDGFTEINSPNLLSFFEIDGVEPTVAGPTNESIGEKER